MECKVTISNAEKIRSGTCTEIREFNKLEFMLPGGWLGVMGYTGDGYIKSRFNYS